VFVLVLYLTQTVVFVVACKYCKSNQRERDSGEGETCSQYPFYLIQGRV